MPRPNPNYVRDHACSDPDGPIFYIADEEVVTQHSFTGQYREAPRIGRELSLSAFRGRVSARDATSYIRMGRPVEEWEKHKIRVRYLHVGRLREAGLAVVHTPGRVAYPEHCSVVWPADDPLNSQVADWLPEIRQASTHALLVRKRDGENEPGYDRQAGRSAVVPVA
jgi:hypothetical protein